MNHNFLSFKITKMLPKENPYSTMAYIDKWGYVTTIYSVESRDAWTVFDVLTWLEEQGYVIETILYSFEDSNTIPTWSVYITENRLNYSLSSKYESRIEAYIEGIKHCLNLIKDEILY